MEILIGHGDIAISALAMTVLVTFGVVGVLCRLLVNMTKTSVADRALIMQQSEAIISTHLTLQRIKELLEGRD